MEDPTFNAQRAASVLWTAALVHPARAYTAPTTLLTFSSLALMGAHAAAPAFHTFAAAAVVYAKHGASALVALVADESVSAYSLAAAGLAQSPPPIVLANARVARVAAAAAAAQVVGELDDKTGSAVLVIL